MGRRRRGETIWPYLLIAGAVGFGIGLGVHSMGGSAPFDRPSRSLEPETESGRETFLPTQADRIRVEVLNAGGLRGAAAEGRDRLRDRGFDVVYFGNASDFGAETTQVLDRTGKPGAAEAVAASLGVSEVRVELDSTLLVDVTVRVGTDWSGGMAGEGSEPEEATGDPQGRGWWDPRRWMETFDGMR